MYISCIASSSSQTLYYTEIEKTMIMIYEGIHIPAAIRSNIGILLADKSKKKIQNKHLWLKSTCVNLKLNIIRV